MAKITRASIEALQPSADLAYLWDSSLPGFGVRITPAGVKSFVLRYRTAGRQRIKTLGRVGVLDLTEATTLAKTRLAALLAGTDPFAAGAAVNTVRDLAEAFQKDRADNLKPKTLAGYESLWKAHIIPALGNRPAGGISGEDMQNFRKKLAKKPITFNRCADLIVTALKWRGIPIEGHPAKTIQRFKENERDKTFTEADLARLHASFAEYKAQRRAGWRYVDLFALLLLTGLRRDEWRLGRWEWIRWDMELYVIPDNKTGGRTVYLPGVAMEILGPIWRAQKCPKSGFIFPAAKTKRKPISWTWRQWDEMRKNLKLEGFTIHDMRRTVGTMAHRKGGLTQRQVADVLGHKRLETSSRYIHDPEKKKAAETAAGVISKAWAPTS